MTEKGYKETQDGQLEIMGLDTPLGEKAAKYLKAVDVFNNAGDTVDACKEEVLAQMEADGMKTFAYEGRIFTEQKEKTVSKTLRVTTKTKKRKIEE